MSKKALIFIWAVLYVLCAALSFSPSPEGNQYMALVTLSLLFFIPGFLLLSWGIKADDHKSVRRICLLSGCSLAATMLVLILNFFAYSASEAVGMVMYVILVLVSVPMVCGQVWMLSLFLWACLLMVSLSYLRRQRNVTDR